MASLLIFLRQISNKYWQGISPIAKIAIAISIFVKFGIAIAIAISIAIWFKIADRDRDRDRSFAIAIFYAIFLVTNKKNFILFSYQNAYK